MVLMKSSNSRNGSFGRLGVSFLGRYLSLIFVLAMGISLNTSCGSSRTLVIVPEPVVDQVSVKSPEICLDSILWIFDRNPCLEIKGVRDNTTLQKRLMLVYKLSSFDVEFPMGLSLSIDGEFYNLTKISTEYGDTLEMVSDLPISLTQSIAKAKSITVSYTNRKHTINTDLSSREISKFNDYLKEIQDLLKKEPKLKIKR